MLKCDIRRNREGEVYKTPKERLPRCGHFARWRQLTPPAQSLLDCTVGEKWLLSSVTPI